MNNTNVLILIPPSERKSVGGLLDPLESVPESVASLLGKLNNFKGNPERLYGFKGRELEAAQLANAMVLSSFTLPAIQRYESDLIEGIDFSTLENREYFNEHVRIVSALFGLVLPEDRLPEYHLRIDKLRAADHWRPIIAQQLRGRFVIDLLTQAYRKAVVFDQGIAVDFATVKNGKKRLAGQFANNIKGRFVRWLVENEITSPDEFKEFRAQGFRWNGKQFLRKS